MNRPTIALLVGGPMHDTRVTVEGEPARLVAWLDGYGWHAADPDTVGTITRLTSEHYYRATIPRESKSLFAPGVCPYLHESRVVTGYDEPPQPYDPLEGNPYDLDRNDDPRAGGGDE